MFSGKERVLSQADPAQSCLSLEILTMLRSIAIKSIKVLQRLLSADFPCPSRLALYIPFCSGYYTALEAGKKRGTCYKKVACPLAVKQMRKLNADSQPPKA